MKKAVREFALMAVSLVPVTYLAMIFPVLPEQVPTHFNMQGDADDWSPKSTLWLMPGVIPVFMYLLLTIIPRLDPKKRLGEMGGKYHGFRFMMVSFFSVLATYMIYVSAAPGKFSPHLLTGLIGVLMIGLGNYMQTLRPNYFIGLRTPWTLESEEVWRRTHRLGGRLAMAGGMLIIILAFTAPTFEVLGYGMMAIVGIVVLLPAIRSYMLFKSLRKA